LSGLLGLVGIESSIRIGPFAAGVVALSTVHAAYASEVFKGAMIAVPPGYLEASKALGLSPWLTFRKIKLPLALRYAFPGLTNLWMVMIKNTPLVSAIGVSDLIRQASRAGENTREYLAFFLAALAVYLVLSGVSLFAQEKGQAHLFRHTFLRYLPNLLDGAWETAVLTSFTLVLGLAIAIPVAMCRLSRLWPLNAFALAFVFFFRGAPLLVLLFLIYFGLADVPLIRETWAWTFFRDAYFCAIIALSLNSAGYLCEVIAGAVRAVPRGEVEAATVAGLAPID
ncbi:unnamed protein product, partial [Ectocarpus sp. 12 AP-2014]